MTFEELKGAAGNIIVRKSGGEANTDVLVFF